MAKKRPAISAVSTGLITAFEEAVENVTIECETGHSITNAKVVAKELHAARQALLHRIYVLEQAVGTIAEMAAEAEEADVHLVRQDICKHEGNKYLRPIQAADSDEVINVDVYCVIDCFQVTNPAQQHALKKLLCCGTRGKGDVLADLKGVLAAANRALDMEERRLRLEARRNAKKR